MPAPVTLQPNQGNDGLYTFTDSNGQPAAGTAVDAASGIYATQGAAAAAQFIARLPVEQQQAVWQNFDSRWKTSRTDQVQQLVQQERQNAFKRGELLPGVDRSGNGTNLKEAELQSILSSGLLDDVDQLASEQPGEDAYTYDPTLDEGPGYTLLDKLNEEGAFYDENVDGMDVSYEDALKQERSDTTGVDAQRRSLDEYDQIIAQEGLTDIDRARIERMRQDTARRGRAQEEAILADAAEKGRAGGNASLLLRSQAQQRATNERALGDMETAAIGLQRKDSAITNRGFLGGDVQAGVDAIDKFNVENSQGVLERNTDRDNKAEYARWAEERDNKNENVAITQGAIGVDYDADTERSDRNTDRVNAAEVSNDVGARERWRDKWAAHNQKIGATTLGPAYTGALGRGASPATPGDSGLAGAGAGLASGAAIGTQILPGWGTAGGAAVGFATGFLGSRKSGRSARTGWE